MEPIVLIDVDRCVGCYMCQRACALAQCIEINEFTRFAEVVRPEDCTGCMACERACPYNCIEVLSEGVDVSARAKVTLSRVRRYMNKRLRTVFSTTTVKEGAMIMTKENIGSLLIWSDKLKIATETDILNAWYTGKENELLVAFSHEAVTVEGRATVQEALEVMIKKGIGHLPVLERGKLVGMLSIRDALRASSVTSPVKDQGIFPINPNGKVREFVKTCPVLQNPTNEKVLVTLREHGLKALLVRDNDRVGLISVRDLTKALALGRSLKDHAEPRWVKPISAEESISKAIAIMMEHNIRNMPVIDGEELKILSVKEIAKHAIWITAPERGA
ncbi:CBS domain-containing protein [Metallosphaera tengchongensis]|uniref:CBS domain-containing protein n=1 Tax=Metallosphaera tengchongensis TaxID=1532350 RepID=A0A6N0NWW6_9CREN|nr:CBS domain-containing protein [Metallosphaera tengchongensis]QKR00119.1 CBS domain-containing protein [Metallosphaera tengchongensis]